MRVRYKTAYSVPGTSAKEKYGCTYLSGDRRKSMRRNEYGALFLTTQLLVMMLIITAFFYLLEKNHLFCLSRINIHSSDELIRSEITRVTSGLEGRHIIGLSLDWLKARLLENRQIESVSIKYSMFPLVMDIRAKKRQFWAVAIQGDSMSYIDIQGDIIKLEDYDSKGLVPVYIKTSDTRVVKDSLQNIIKFYNTISRHIPVYSCRIDLLSTRVMADGIQILLPGIPLSAKYADALEHVLKDPGKKTGIIDIRFRDFMIVKDKRVQ